MKKRWFIVRPQWQEDNLWKVCSTTSKMSFLSVYIIDDYEEERDFDNKQDAVQYARSRGHRKAYII